MQVANSHPDFVVSEERRLLLRHFYSLVIVRPGLAFKRNPWFRYLDEADVNTEPPWPIEKALVCQPGPLPHFVEGTNQKLKIGNLHIDIDLKEHTQHLDVQCQKRCVDRCNIEGSLANLTCGECAKLIWVNLIVPLKQFLGTNFSASGPFLFCFTRCGIHVHGRPMLYAPGAYTLQYTRVLVGGLALLNIFPDLNFKTMDAAFAVIFSPHRHTNAIKLPFNSEESLVDLITNRIGYNASTIPDTILRPHVYNVHCGTMIQGLLDHVEEYLIQFPEYQVKYDG